MKFVLCSVFDSAVNTFSPPMASRAVGQAIRSFRQEASNPDSPLFKSAKDYTLFILGTFDDESGTFSSEPAPRRLITAHEALSEVSNG